MAGAAWTAKFDELDADKNGELDVLELRGYEPADYVKAPCANWNGKVRGNAEKIAKEGTYSMSVADSKFTA